MAVSKDMCANTADVENDPLGSSWRSISELDIGGTRAETRNGSSSPMPPVPSDGRPTGLVRAAPPPPYNNQEENHRSLSEVDNLDEEQLESAAPAVAEAPAGVGKGKSWDLEVDDPDGPRSELGKPFWRHQLGVPTETQVSAFEPPTTPGAGESKGWDLSVERAARVPPVGIGGAAATEVCEFTAVPESP
mmetsp:Transcript_64888/g.180615  ORF Transcript_64888/g.180615 Transcript_64888/m.180615 type:complete len:190 (-) Transcript_64888:227-796(-)